DATSMTAPPGSALALGRGSVPTARSWQPCCRAARATVRCSAGYPPRGRSPLGRARSGDGRVVPMTTTTSVASPVDFDTSGDYAAPAGAYRVEGNVTSLVYPIDGRISDDGSTEFAAEPGRYHLYFSLYCPWAQRPLIALRLRGLDGVVSWSAVDPVRDGRGWAFRSGRGYGPDP